MLGLGTPLAGEWLLATVFLATSLLAASLVVAGIGVIVYRGDRANRRLVEHVEQEEQSPRQLPLFAVDPRLIVSNWAEQSAFAPDAKSIAATLFENIVFWERWIHRRVETLELLDDARVRRHVSVDFTMPKNLGTKGTTWPDAVVVPIGLAYKEVFKNFASFGGTTAAVPVLTRTQTRIVTYFFLVGIAETLEKRSLDPERRRQLLYVIGSSPAQARARLNILRGRRPEPGRGIRAQRRSWCNRHQPAPPGDPLWSQAPLGAFMDDFAIAFLLMIVLPKQPGHRLIAKYEHETDLGRHSIGLRPGRLLRVALEKVGLAAARVRIPINSLGLSDSYHAEIGAPPGLAISRARLTIRRGREWVPIADDPVGIDRAHLHLESSPPAGNLSQRPDSWIGTQATIDLRLRLRPESLLRPAFLISWLISALLASGLALRLLGISEHQDPAVVLLVALPTIFAVYLAAPGEHRMVQRLVGTVRDFVWFSAFAAFVAGCSLVLTVPGGFRFRLWEVLTAVSTVVTVTMFMSIRLSRWQLGRRLASLG